MGFEARKTNRLRGETFVRTYFAGRVLDIGCGPDPVTPAAQPFDIEQGDAARILDYLEPETFDCVHSSHCLEHMPNVPDALAQWWALVRPGGYMVLVVPEEDLYEQGFWPSIFNDDHKATFRLDRARSWSPASYELRSLLAGLPGCQIVDLKVQDDGYDRALLRPIPAHFKQLRNAGARTILWLHWRRCGVLHRLGIRPNPNSLIARLERKLGLPVAQTDGEALAQIQAVVRKLPITLPSDNHER